MANSQYAPRRGLKSADRGVRKVAGTFGKTALLTHGSKANGLHAVEGDAERLVSNLLSLDPRVSRYTPQSMTVDIAEGRLLKTAEDRSLARARHKKCGTAPLFYTPDFSCEWVRRPSCLLEVKSDRYPGDAEYDEKLSRAQCVLLAHGFEFMKVIVPANELHPVHVNVPLLYQASFRSDLRPGSSTLDAIDDLQLRGASTLGEYCRGLSMDMRMAPVLITFGFLSVAVTKQEFRANTPATPANGSLEHLCILEEFVA